MLRKLSLYVFFGLIIAGAIYSWRTYSAIVLYEPGNPKVTYMFVVKKPASGWDLFYNHIDQKKVEREIEVLRFRNQSIPWHMDYDRVVNSAIYHMTFKSDYQEHAE